MTDTITITCLIHHDKPDHAFAVDISKNKFVFHLKKLILDERHDILSNVVAVNLNLWKANIPSNDANALESLDLENMEILQSTWGIADYFRKQPAKRHIHVIVAPSPSSSKFFSPTMLMRSTFMFAVKS